MKHPSLFDLPESKSPRLLWMEKHGVKTFLSTNMSAEDDPWCAWLKEWGNEAWEVVEKMGDARIGYGRTHDDAVFDLAKKCGIPLWNEEEISKP